MTMTQTELYATFNAMQREGGSFVRALSVAWVYADPDNRALIEQTWPDLVEKYRPRPAPEFTGLSETPA